MLGLLVIRQLLLVLAASLSLFLGLGWTHSYSALLGGISYILPTAWGSLFVLMAAVAHSVWLVFFGIVSKVVLCLAAIFWFIPSPHLESFSFLLGLVVAGMVAPVSLWKL